MQINVSYDASVNGAPAGFTSDVQAAVQYLDALFTNAVSITIDVGYGEIAGQRLASGDLGESLWSQNVPQSYAAVANALQGESAPGSFTLPVISPDNGTLQLSPAEARALGFSVSDSGIEGYVGFSAAPNTFSYAVGTAPPSNEYYFIGVVEHQNPLMNAGHAHKRLRYRQRDA